MAGPRCKPSSVKFTAVFSAATVANADDRHYIGVGDANNGLFVGYSWDADASSAVFSFIHRSGGTDTVIKQADWDVAAPFATFDPTKGNVYRIQYAWLGFGPLVLSIQNPVTRRFVLAHTIKYPSTSTEVSLRVPSLPICLECKRSSAGSDIVIHTPSMGAAIEGKDVLLGRSFGFASTTEHGDTLAKNTNTVLLSVRNRATLDAPFGGAVSAVDNTLRVRLKTLAVALRGSGADKMAVVMLYRNLDFGARAEVDAAQWSHVHSSSTCSVQSLHDAAVTVDLGHVMGTIDSTTASSVTLTSGALSDMTSSLASTSWVTHVPFVSGESDTGQSWPVVSKTSDTTVTLPLMPTVPNDGRSIMFHNGVCILSSVMSEGAINLNLTPANLFLNPGESVTVVIRPTTANIRAIAALTWNEYS